MKPFRIIILLFLILSFKQVKSQTDSLKIYPNPFTDTLNIQVYLVGNDTVTITVVSIIGQIVKTLAYDSIMAAGNHTIIYDASSLADGIYFVTMKAGGQTIAKKVIKTGTTNSIETLTESTSRINIFPNPNNGNITLQNHNELGLIMVYNNAGEFIYQQITKENNTKIDISSQPNGIYLIRIGNSLTKVIKQESN
jgi:hypothetical protein